jgi:D-lactate dehydrogenase
MGRRKRGRIRGAPHALQGERFDFLTRSAHPRDGSHYQHGLDRLMKRGVMLINVSRGRLVDTTALIAGLKRGHIGGVALDVYEEEEGVFFEDLSGEVLQDDELARLLSFPNVLITSHQAFLTEEALREISRVTIQNLRRFTTGQSLLEGTAL